MEPVQTTEGSCSGNVPQCVLVFIRDTISLGKAIYSWEYLPQGEAKTSMGLGEDYTLHREDCLSLGASVLGVRSGVSGNNCPCMGKRSGISGNLQTVMFLGNNHFSSGGFS